jgi:hypothetical protein
MVKGTFSIEIKCAHCGSAVLEFPDNLTDSTIINCAHCGRGVGHYGALRAEAGDEFQTTAKSFNRLN